MPSFLTTSTSKATTTAGKTSSAASATLRKDGSYLRTTRLLLTPTLRILKYKEKRLSVSNTLNPKRIFLGFLIGQRAVKVFSF